MATHAFQRSSRLPLYLTQALSGVAYVTLGPLLDSILRDLGIPLAHGGLLPLSFFLGQVVALVAFNVLLARVPVKWCLVGAAVLQAAGLGAAGLLARGFWSFILPYFVAGCAEVLLAAVPGIWISSHVKEGTARAITLMMMSSVATMTLTPVVLGVLLNAGAGWRTILAGEAGLSLLLGMVLVLLPLVDIQERENLRLRQVRTVAAFNPRLLAAIAGAAFLYIGGEMTLGVWLPKFELDTFGASPAWAGLAVTFYFVGQIVGRVVIVPFTGRLLTSWLLFVSTGMMAVFAIGISLAPSLAISLALTFGAGLGSSAAFSLIGSYAGKFPYWYGGVVYSAFQFSAGIGGMVFPYLTGPVAASLGFRVAIGFAALPMLIVALLAFRLREAAGEARRLVAKPG
ncbi:MAG: MFS transporter [Actinobacteria bacterium]|nr:MFS transporter [Actinomycetota bacterium]